MDEFHSRPSRMRAVDRANAAHTTWIGVSLLALLLVDGLRSSIASATIQHRP
jgi:hypothetical protein